MNKTIVYWNRIEVKILAIVCGIVWGVLYAITTIGDIVSQNPVFWHNQKCVWLMGFVFAIPVLIIFRFRIIFDFNNRTITHIGYFSRKKRYSFDEVTVSMSTRALPAPQYFIFKINNQKLFQISELDFKGQTYENADCLKTLFKGDAKLLYDIEQSVSRKGYRVAGYTYALTDHIFTIFGNAFQYWIYVGFRAENKVFYVEVRKTQATGDMPYTEKLVEETTADFESLECRILDLARRYLVSG